MTAGRLLLLLRHAATADEPGTPDKARRLGDRGRHAARLVGAELRAGGLLPGHVLSSSAVRATQTVEALCLPAGTPVEVTDALYLADVDTLLERVRTVHTDPAALLVVAHNPGIHGLALELAGEDARPGLRDFPTAALATLAVDGPWAELSPTTATLVNADLTRR